MRRCWLPSRGKPSPVPPVRGRALHGALCDDCELTHLGGDEINTRLIFPRAHTARTAVEQNTVARSVSQATAGRPRKQPVLNMREFLGALVRVALEARRGAGQLSGASAKLAALARPGRDVLGLVSWSGWTRP